MKWLQEGERNTRFFNKAAVHHRQINRLIRLGTEEGLIKEPQEDLEQSLNSFFSNLLEEPDEDKSTSQREVLRHIPQVITEEHNLLLLKPIEMDEVEEVVKQMAKDKALGPDGFTTNFFHACWDWLKEEFRALVEDSRKLGNILKALNATFLTLIPKELGIEDPGKLRPIALCNAIYKIISKTIANRLHPLLPLIISPKQARFVEGRQILDGIILIHETI